MKTDDDMGIWEIAVKFGGPILVAILKTVAEKVFSSIL